MSALDLGSLLDSVDPDDPAGPDLEYDQAFIDLEEAARGQPEQQYGSTIVPAQEPDWPVVQRQSTALLKRSKDLRAATHLLQALTHRQGFEGLGQGLALLRGLLEGFWNGLHPRLDPEDDLDPTARINIIAMICGAAFLSQLRVTPIFVSRLAGRVSLREVQIARGMLPPDDGSQPPTLEGLHAAAADLPPDDLRAIIGGIQQAIADVTAIEAFITEQVGAANAMSFEPLAHLLREVRSVLTEVPGAGAQDEALSADAAGADDVVSAGAGAVPKATVRGEIASREDVIQAIDRIVAYYRRHEPASPVPLLLQRAKRLVHLGFMEIVQDLAPEAVASVSQIAVGRGAD